MRPSTCLSLVALGALTLGAVVPLAACGGSTRPSFTAEEPDAATSPPDPPPLVTKDPVDAGGGKGPCPDLPTTTSGNVTLAPEFDGVYSVYELGQVPGIDSDKPLGGTVLLDGTTDTLLIGGASEQPDGALYKVKVKRDACDHIVGFDGVAKRDVDAPFVDANLVYGPGGVLLFPQWSGMGVHKIGQLAKGATTIVETSTQPLGIGGGGPGSMGFVPPSIPGAAGELRVLTQNGAQGQDGFWYHVPYTQAANGTLTLGAAKKTATLPNWPGGFAYIPAGSPGFDAQALIVAEWSKDSVAVYGVNEGGDPVVASRKPFFTKFVRPWGAYFEPVTGDFLFLTWRATEGSQILDKVWVVSGFKPPPPPPTPK